MSVFFTLAMGAIFLAVLRLWGIWLGLRKLLLTLDSLPLRNGFESIKEFTWKPIWRLGAGSLQEFQRIFHREKEAFDIALNTLPLDKGRLEEEWQKTLDRHRELGAIQHPYSWHWWARRKMELALIRQFGRYQGQVANLAGRALEFLAGEWEQRKEQKEYSIDIATDKELGVRAWERAVCYVYISFILVMLVRIRTLVVGIGGMYVLTLVGIMQYPFEPKAAVHIILIALLVFVIAVVGLVFAQIYRDAILSYITDTKPGELGGDFWVRIISFSILPVLSLLASQFATVNRFFYAWLQPAVQALNR
jgi:hypothetical protein